MTERIYKIYPSSAAFMSGPLVETTKNGSCFRFLWAQAHCGAHKYSMKPNIAEEHSALGTLDETRYAMKLDKQKVSYKREVSHSIPFKNCEIAFRVDFDFEDGTIGEKKSTTSDGLHKTVFKDNDVDANHLAQLVSYLSLLKRDTGKLIVTYYEMSEEFDAYLALEEREILVKLSTDGVISLDGVEYRKNAKDLARWYAGLQQCLTETSTVPPAPMPQTVKFKNPCFSCPLSATCEKYKNETMPVAQFLLEAKEAFEAPRESKKFNIKVLTKRRQANKDKKKEQV